MCGRNEEYCTHSIVLVQQRHGKALDVAGAFDIGFTRRISRFSQKCIHLQLQIKPIQQNLSCAHTTSSSRVHSMLTYLLLLISSKGLKSSAKMISGS